MRTLILALAFAAAVPAASAQTVDTSPQAIISVDTNQRWDWARIDVYQRDGTYAVYYITQYPIAGYAGLSSQTAELMVMLFSAYWGRLDYPQQQSQRIYLSGVYQEGSIYYLVRNSALLYNPTPKTTNAPEPTGQVGTLAAMTIYEDANYWGQMLLRRPSGAFTTYYFLKREMTFDAVKQPLAESEMRMMLEVILGARNYIAIDRTVNLGSGYRVIHGGGAFWGSRVTGY